MDLVRESGYVPDGRDLETVLRDIQIIYGITDTMTKADLEAQIQEDTKWNASHPDGPYQVTPDVVHGFDGFYYQNVGNW